MINLDCKHMFISLNYILLVVQIYYRKVTLEKIAQFSDLKKKITTICYQNLMILTYLVSDLKKIYFEYS